MRISRAKPNTVNVVGTFDGKPEDANNTNVLRSYIVEAEEAERVVRVAKGRTYYISARGHAIARDQSDAKEDTVMTVRVYGNVIVGKAEALRYLKNTYNAKLRETALVRLTISDTCVFIG